MVDESKKSLAEIITAVKQESLANFEKAYHQKNVVNKLSFLGISLDGLIACDEKTEQDSSATKEAVDAAKAEHETNVKLKEKLQHDHDALKALAAPKDAKQFIEKLDEAT
jgi:predicted amidohydrolase